MNSTTSSLGDLKRKCAVYDRVSKGFDSQKTAIPTQIKLFKELTVGTEAGFFNWLKAKVEGIQQKANATHT